MSTQKRKITYWSIDFIKGSEHVFDGSLLCRFMTYVAGLDEATRLEKNSKTNKAISLQNVKEDTVQSSHLLKVIFKSCKFNHSPAYLSSIDGSERPSTKKLDEGEKELTHVCMRIDDSEAYTAFEERRNGITMNTMIRYLNHYLECFLKLECIEEDYMLWASIIPSEDFLIALDKTIKISSLELFVDNEILGSGFLNLMDLDANSQEDIIMTVKSKPRQSLTRKIVREAFLRIGTEGYKPSRIRIRGKDINKMNVTIDSINGKKTNEITVNLLENGVVDTYSIFSKLEEILGVTK